MATDSIVELNDNNFEKEVLQSKIPVMVDFWAEWCGPCKALSSLIDEIAAENKSKIKVGKVNIDNAEGLSSAYSIMSVPTVLFFKDGEVVEQFSGARAKSVYQDTIKNL